VYPNAVFFRLLKFPLIGEIARKLKMSEDEVKEIFEEQAKSKEQKDNSKEEQTKSEEKS
jgi:hypothetical protein